MRPLLFLLSLVALAVALAVMLWALGRGSAPPAPPPESGLEPGSTVLEGAGRSPVAPAGGREVAGSPGDTVALVGRLLDVEGLPFTALAVVLRAPGVPPRTATTDHEGSFAFEGLARTIVQLDLSADFDEAVPLGERTLACQLDPLTLDLGREPDLGSARIDSARIDSGTHVLPRSRPCWIEGRVVLDEDWAREKGVWLGDVRIEVETPPPEELFGALPTITTPPGAPPDWRSPPWRRDLPAGPALEVDGSFRFAVETPHDPFLVRARLKRFEPCEVYVRPTPDGLVQETLQLPPE